MSISLIFTKLVISYITKREVYISDKFQVYCKQIRNLSY